MKPLIIYGVLIASFCFALSGHLGLAVAGVVLATLLATAFGSAKA